MQFDPGTLPVAQLESLKFKVSQIMESIQSLQANIEQGGHNTMPSWPEILTKYNVLLSQTHSLSTTLVTPMPQQNTSGSKVNGAGRNQASSSSKNTNAFSRFWLHPSLGLTDTQLDNDLTPLLRNQQTNEVLSVENDTVRRLSERLLDAPLQGAKTLSDNQSVLLQRCSQIKSEHDTRCERAVRAVTMLREKYDWKARVEVEMEEPEDFVPLSPLLQQSAQSPLTRMSPIPSVAEVDIDMDQNAPDDEDENSGDEEEELEEVLGPSLRATPGNTPRDE